MARRGLRQKAGPVQQGLMCIRRLVDPPFHRPGRAVSTVSGCRGVMRGGRVKFRRPIARSTSWMDGCIDASSRERRGSVMVEDLFHVRPPLALFPGRKRRLAGLADIHQRWVTGSAAIFAMSAAKSVP